MMQYQPPTGIAAVNLQDFQSNSANEEFEELVADEEETSNLGVLSLESASDLDDHLMQELDSDLVNLEEEQSNFIMQHMDIQQPLSSLRLLLEQRLGLSFAGYSFYLQGTQMVI